MAEDKHLKPKRGSASSAEYKKIILKKGEVFFEKPENEEYGKIKMGDGISEYFELPYFLEKQVINKATTSEEGLMPPEDKTKLDNLKIGNGKLSIYQYPNLLSDEFSANESNYVNDIDVDCTSLPEPNIWFDLFGNLQLTRKNSAGEIVGVDREYMVALSDEIAIIKDGEKSWLMKNSNTITYYTKESFRNENVIRLLFRHFDIDSWIKIPFKNSNYNLDKNYLKITLFSDLATPIDIKIQNSYYSDTDVSADIDESTFPAKYITLEPGIWQTFYINLNLFKVTRSIYNLDYSLQFLFPTPAEGITYNIYFKEIINTNEEQFFIN